jgi:hypothetical protein
MQNIKMPQLPKLEPPKSDLTDDARLRQNLESQARNLNLRLEEIGAEPKRSIPQRALNLPDENNLFMNIIDVIERPLRAVQAGLMSASEGTNIAQNMWSAFSGKDERFTGLEFATRMGWVRNPESLTGFESFLVNVATDILFDPLTYFGPVKMYKMFFGKAKTFTSITGQKLKALEKGLSAKGKTLAAASWDEVATLSKELGIEFLTSKELKQLGVKTTKDLPQFLQKASKTVKKGKKTVKGSNLEGAIGEIFGKYFDEMGEAGTDFFVYMKRTASQQGADLQFLKRMNVGGEEVYMLLQNLEVKDMLSKAYGSSMTLGIKGNKIVIKGKNFQQLPKEVQQKFLKALNELKIQSGKKKVPVAKVLSDMVESGTKQDDFVKAGLQKFTKSQAYKTASEAKKKTLLAAKKKELAKQAQAQFGKTSFDLAPFLDEAVNLGDGTTTSFRELFQDMLVQNKDSWYAFRDPSGQIKVAQGANFFDLIDSSGNIMYSAAGGAVDDLGMAAGRQLRMFPGMGLSEGFQTVDDQFIDFMASMVGKDMDKPAGLAIRLMDNLVKESTPGLIRRPAQAIRAVTQELGALFNAGNQMTREFMSKYARIGGKQASKLQRYQRQATEISTRLAKANANYDTFLTQIAEASATVVDGKIKYGSTILSTSDYLKNVKIHAKAGNVAFLPVSGTVQAKKNTANNIVKQLNDMYFDMFAVKDAFKVKQKGASFGLVLNNIDYDTFAKADFSTVGDIYKSLNFGTAKLSKEAQEFLLKNTDDVAQIIGLKNTITDELVKELGFSALPDAMTGTAGYVRHTLTKEFRDVMAQSAPLVRSQYITEGVNMIQARDFIGSIDEVNQGLRAFFGLEVDAFTTSFMASMDDLMGVSMRMNEQHKVLKLILDSATDAGQPLFQVLDNVQGAGRELGRNFKLVESFDTTFGNIMKNLSPQAQKELTEHLAKLGFEKGKKVLAIHRTSFDMLKKVNKGYVELPKFVRMYDKFMNFWKSITLVTPGFHMRNLFGNSSNMYLQGMNMGAQSRYSVRAMTDFGNYRKILSKLDELGGATDDIIKTLSKGDQQLYRRMTNFINDGISQANVGVKDLKSVKTALEQSGRKKLSQKLVGVNFDFAEKMDDFQRYMMYQWSYDKTVNKFVKEFGQQAGELKAREAARVSVEQSLFNYKNLTGFEQEYMKRLFPFYTFMKNNLVFQMQNIFKNPGAYGRMGRAYKYYVDDMTGIDIEGMPDYMLDNMWLPFPGMINKGDQESISFLKANLPFAEFTEIIENPLKRGVTSIAAPIKLTMEVGTGLDFFTGRRIEEFPGQEKRMEPGTGIFAGIRGEQGELALSANPLAQKIANDLGFRVPQNYLGILLEVADAAAGYQTRPEMILNVFERLGLSTTKAVDEISLTELYQDLEKLRNIRSLFEQQTRDKLPTLDDLGMGRPPRITPPGGGSGQLPRIG